MLAEWRELSLTSTEDLQKSFNGFLRLQSGTKFPS
jgi:hypothetical protein